MLAPAVTEITRTLEPVSTDTFIDGCPPEDPVADARRAARTDRRQCGLDHRPGATTPTIVAPIATPARRRQLPNWRRTSLVVAAPMALVLCAATASADARTRWYWSETTAETALVRRYADVNDARCTGISAPYQPRADDRGATSVSISGSSELDLRVDEAPREDRRVGQRNAAQGPMKPEGPSP